MRLRAKVGLFCVLKMTMTKNCDNFLFVFSQIWSKRCGNKKCENLVENIKLWNIFSLFYAEGLHLQQSRITINLHLEKTTWHILIFSKMKLPFSLDFHLPWKHFMRLFFIKNTLWPYALLAKWIIQTFVGLLFHLYILFNLFFPLNILWEPSPSNLILSGFL